jgi:hypothetical protein
MNREIAVEPGVFDATGALGALLRVGRGMASVANVFAVIPGSSRGALAGVYIIR